MEKLMVSCNTNPAKLAGAIAECIRKEENVELQAIGAAAVNQAVKGITVARKYLADEKDIVCIPSFIDKEVGGKVLSAIRFVVTQR